MGRWGQRGRRGRLGGACVDIRCWRGMNLLSVIKNRNVQNYCYYYPLRIIFSCTAALRTSWTQHCLDAAWKWKWDWTSQSLTKGLHVYLALCTASSFLFESFILRPSPHELTAATEQQTTRTPMFTMFFSGSGFRLMCGAVLILAQCIVVIGECVGRACGLLGLMIMVGHQ